MIEKMQKQLALLKLLYLDNISSMRSLKNEFDKKYPPRRGTWGFGLTANSCKGCEECPHSLRWREYSYLQSYMHIDKLTGKKTQEFKFRWKDRRFTALPKRFWESSRAKEVLEAFRYFDDRVKLLNRNREKLSRARLSIKQQLNSIEKDLMLRRSE